VIHSTPFFPKFTTAVRPVAGKLQELATASLSHLAALFEHRVGPELLAKAPSGPNSRQRVFSVPVTFWAFLSQILSPNSSCREAVRKVGALLHLEHSRQIDEDTSAYCQARLRLPLQLLKKIGLRITNGLENMSSTAKLWQGRVVKIADGTTLSMPDTAANQKRWPQPNSQKPGCGFPMIRLVGLFSLASGALLQTVTDTFFSNENNLFERLFKFLDPGDVVLTDRNFCSYGNISALLSQKVDVVMRMHQSRPADFRKGKALGKNHRLIRWQKPTKKPRAMSQQQFDLLPAQITLRMLRLHISAPGFRTRKIVLVTTLLDTKLYPPESLTGLYRRRWGVELFFRDIKTTMKMDVLRCKSPAMIERELAMHWIAYNLIRTLMLEASLCYDVALDRLSFKGTVDTLRQWAPVIAGTKAKSKRRSALINALLWVIATDQVSLRPNRREPRAVKRRPKPFQLLNRPRHRMKDTPHRDKFYSRRAKKRGA
jgi:Transposase DDE domain